MPQHKRRLVVGIAIALVVVSLLGCLAEGGRATSSVKKMRRGINAQQEEQRVIPDILKQYVKQLDKASENGKKKLSEVLGNTLPLLSNAFGSNMVLQADTPAILYGFASSNTTTISVLFNGAFYNATSFVEPYLLWYVALPPVSPSFTAYDIAVYDIEAEDNVKLTNVLFGDVYLCGGQSNMQFTVDQGFNATEEVQDANFYSNIRLFTVGQGTFSTYPLPVFATIEQGWSIASNTSVGGGNWTEFSAVCWFFVRDLYRVINRPIGAISTNWGGTLIQAWSSNEALDACNSHVGPPPANNTNNPNYDTILYNAMIVPLLLTRVKGALWYQGEANVFQASVYACAFPAMINDWRTSFQQDFGFYFVQLAAYTEGMGTNAVALPQTREAQTAGLELPNVGMAVAADLGDLGSPFGNIHPRNKQEVGNRLVLVALQKNYGFNIVANGPTPDGYEVLSSGSNNVVNVNFTTYSSSLYLVSNVTCPSSLVATNCSGFQIQTSDGSWNDATVTLVDAKTIQLQAEGPSSYVVPQTIRYGFSNWPLISLYNSYQLPAPPFELPLNY